MGRVGTNENGPNLLPTSRLGADRPAQSFWVGSGSNGTASLLDLLAGGGADALDLDGQFTAQITRTEDLDGVTIAIHKALLTESGFVDHCTVFECVVERAHVDDFIHVAELDVAKAFLWQTTEEWHLTTFETGADTLTCTSLLTLVAFAGGLSVTGAFTAADALTALLGAWAGFDVLELHKNLKRES